ncbi:MAG: DUF1553 domain-containing protein [Planctomycetota bacterium]
MRTNRPFSKSIAILTVGFCILCPWILRADETSEKSLELFEKHVRPTILSECIRCHGPDKQQGGLRLDSRQSIRKGGDSGPAIVPGDPKASLLIQAITYDDSALEMPPRGKLPESTISGFVNWIQTGATDPREASIQSVGLSNVASIEEGKKFWCFQPVKAVEVPTNQNAAWSRTDIDRFIYDRLGEKEVQPNPLADRATLLRRAYYDLIGLPPTPTQVIKFINDDSPGAYNSVIDELLASPNFGERWGRHWLDVVRFAESSGGGRTLLFKDAWRYRDYVIDAFNADMPYDQFLREQIAGDLLPHRDWQERRRQLIATAFLVLGPTNYELQDKDMLEMDVIDEQLDTLGKATMGMTIGCARCHDHKFDPIPTADYYAMAGILKSTNFIVHDNVSKWSEVDLPESPEREREIVISLAKLKELEKTLKVAKSNKLSDSIAAESLPGIVIDDKSAEVVGDWKSSTFLPRYVDGRYIHDQETNRGNKKVVFTTNVPSDGEYEVRIAYSASSNRSSRVPVVVEHASGAQTIIVNQKEQPSTRGLFHSLGRFDFRQSKPAVITVSNEGTDDGVVIADAVQLIATADLKNAAETETASPALSDRDIKSLTAKIKKLKKQASRSVAMATSDRKSVGDVPIAIRGLVHNKGPIVGRGVLRVASNESISASISDGESGRRELAGWIASPENPLTARVIVNRVWHWLIGRGIVATVDNFGSMGARPTHPELLDYLANRFVNEGWSIKKLIREIMLSRVYQMSSTGNSESLKRDPENRLCWRMHRKRLTAESIRDSLLYVGGSLDETIGGRNIKAGTKIEYGYQFTSTRRSVYVPVFRNTLPELFEVFDFADPNTQRGKRSESVIASQALFMMNHPFVMAQATAAAKRNRSSCEVVEQQIERAFLEVLGRLPTEREQRVTQAFLEQAADTDSENAQALASVYQSLFSCIDFRYLN